MLGALYGYLVIVGLAALVLVVLAQLPDRGLWQLLTRYRRKDPGGEL